MEEYKLEYYPNSAKEAKEKGYKYYFTGKPCIHGHYSLKRANGNKCKVCDNKRSRENKKRWYHENKHDQEFMERYLANNRKWSKENKEYYDNYRKEHKEELRIKRNERNKKYFAENIQAKIAANLRNRLNQAIKNNQKGGSAVRDLGCSIEALKNRIESMWEDGMSWDNYTLFGWHIDHIKPLSSFDLTNRIQFLEANHYTNLQPMWATDNLQKSSKIGE